MKKRLFRNAFLCFAAAMSVILSGCSESSEAQTTVSPAALKEKYSAVENTESADNSMMPMYNVARDEQFEFDFKCNLYDIHGDYDYVTVHTDKSCSEESRVYTVWECTADENGSHLTVGSAGGVLDTEADRSESFDREISVWGNAPIYYLAVRYDTESKTPRRLDTPVVIPFTLRSEITIPQLSRVIDGEGRFSLEWNKVDGADSYNVYTLIDGNQDTGKTNKPVRGAQTGYAECTLLLCENTKETSFEGFAGGDSNLNLYRCHTDDKLYAIGQNYSVCGDYCVTAVKNGRESGLSCFVSTSDVVLPHTFTEESDILFNTYTSVSQLPSYADILNIDGSVTQRRLQYILFTGVSFSGKPVSRYAYSVEGTALTGYVTMDVEDESALPRTVGELSVAGAAIPDNNISKSPPQSISPPLPHHGNDIAAYQIQRTKDSVISGDKKQVPLPAANKTVFADSAEEEWLAINMLNGETEIPLDAFPSLQNAFTLEDTVYKVYFQNPYILGLYSFSYDYDKTALDVDYIYNRGEITARQDALSDETDKVLSALVTSDMTQEQKQLAVYNFLESSVSYDSEALEGAKKTGFVKTSDFAYDDSFSAYGALINRRGVCLAYANAYKLLCSGCGIDCRVCTGYLYGSLPHAWNLIGIDGKWYNCDSANNSVTVGIPFYLYNCDTATAQSTGFSSDSLFELDKALSGYCCDDTSHEYYHSKGLAADSLESYTDVLDKALSADCTAVCIRYTGDTPDRGQFVQSVRKVYFKHGLEDRLASLSCTVSNGFIRLEQK